MLPELREVLQSVDPTQDKIRAVSESCQKFITEDPSMLQELIDTWTSTMESSPQKIALIFLVNDVIQNSRSDKLKQLLQKYLPRAFSLACSSPSAAQDLRKVLQVWEERTIYPIYMLQDWEKLIERQETKADRSSLYAISLAKKLKKLKLTEEEGKNIKTPQDDLIREIISTMKKLDHSHLDTCLYLQKINQRLENNKK